MTTRAARVCLMVVVLGTSVSACKRPVQGPPRDGRNRKPANVPLYAVIYDDDNGNCTKAFAPYDEPVRAKVGDKVWFEVLNLCQQGEPDVTLEATSDGDPFDPQEARYTIRRVRRGDPQKRPLIVGKHANPGQDTKIYKFNLLFHTTKIDPRLEVDP